MQKRRVYVDEKLYQVVKQFAQDRWLIFQERSPEGIRLTHSFPAALNRYIELTKEGKEHGA